MFSPRPWGCSVVGNGQGLGLQVFPTPVGMFRIRRVGVMRLIGFPHARGDVPFCRRPNYRKSPVFPTPVGMFLLPKMKNFFRKSFPHARGDVPAIADAARAMAQFSPRPWGCSGEAATGIDATLVFPTPVGMFRQTKAPSPIKRRFPHARGDVPHSKAPFGSHKSFSPRPWGCSESENFYLNTLYVFPTPVGMFRSVSFVIFLLYCFPHARGDVPFEVLPSLPERPFSPRPWGCSDNKHPNEQYQEVFPTPVGMFRPCICHFAEFSGFPHARGDVPISGGSDGIATTFSPRPWGCSDLENQQ